MVYGSYAFNQENIPNLTNLTNNYDVTNVKTFPYMLFGELCTFEDFFLRAKHIGLNGIKKNVAGSLLNKLLLSFFYYKFDCTLVFSPFYAYRSTA